MSKAHPSSTPSVGQQRQCVVLLVDDDPAILDYFKPTLSTDTLSCVTAASVREAVQALQNGSFDLLVLDWGLDQSGVEVLRAARDSNPGMPVIAISGLPYEVRTDAVMHRVDAFLHKPLSGEVLRSQVMQLLQRSGAPSLSLPRRAEEVLPLEQFKASYIEHVVNLFDNNASLAAKALGIHRQTVSAALERAESAHTRKCNPLLPSRQGESAAGANAGRDMAWRAEGIGRHKTE